ncbi:glycoside hydrolase [Absidia repens]|uniref:Trehalase n=1 Tax=Absidia repens TaxID=90262 RepID=A0A1X2HKF4_9FUNG|nr:glycoside hydrolase [Absidia repens]
MLTLVFFLVAYLLTQVNALLDSQSTADDLYSPTTCNSPIYCEGPLLKAVQLAQLFADSKTFVDMPTTKPVNKVLEAFQSLGNDPDKKSLQSFVEDHFSPAGSEMKPYNITTEPLVWLDKVGDTKYRGWVNQLHHAWSKLAFKFDTSYLCKGCVSSTLPVRRPFVVPGGRFREFYYWDSYFVIEGLLKSGLNSLALDMIENFLDFVDTFGFMPNGARIYYLNRSQPPFLAEMVNLYYQKTQDISIMKKALPVLDKEYSFWLKNTTVVIRKGDIKYKLNRFNVESHSPRPESYNEDFNTVYNGTTLTTKQQNDLFSNLATGAETGWDYSSRWTKAKTDTPDTDILRTLDTRNIIPVELNALLWSMETHLTTWYEIYGGDITTDKLRRRKVQYYRKQATKRLNAMDALLWNQSQTSFFDYNITSNTQSTEFSPASLYPFWLGALPPRARDPSTLHHVFDSTRRQLKSYPGILASTTQSTSMQWDFPNGWPPLQYIVINSMLNVDALLGKSRYAPLAKVLAQRTAASAYCSWFLTGGSIPGNLEKLSNTTDNGHMFEKFDVRSLTASGSGGEYTVQIGFGWTNGVTLWILNKFNDLVAPDCTSSDIYRVPEMDQD